MECYIINNGLIGVNRAVVLRLIRVIKNPLKIKAIFGIGLEIFVWKTNSFFLIIRKENRISCGLLIDKKLKLCEKIKSELVATKWNCTDAGFKQGELKCLFGILPNLPLSKDQQQNKLLLDVLSVLLNVLKGHYFLLVEDIQKTLFNSDEGLKEDLSYYLFALFNNSETVQTKEMIAVILASFYSQAALPHIYKAIFPFLINFVQSDSSSSSLSSSSASSSSLFRTTVINEMKTMALTRLSNHEHNKILLIENGIVSSLLSFLSSGIEGVSKILLSLSQTTSFAHKNMIIDIPNAVPRVIACLSREPDRRSAKVICEAAGALACCCGVSLNVGGFDECEDNDDDNSTKPGRVNEHALACLHAHDVPLLVLRVLSNLISKFTQDEFLFIVRYFAAAASSLRMFIPPETFRPDANTKKAIKKAVDDLTDKFLHYLKSHCFIDDALIAVLYGFVCLPGGDTIRHLLESGRLQKILSDSCVFFQGSNPDAIYVLFLFVTLLERLCLPPYLQNYPIAATMFNSSSIRHINNNDSSSSSNGSESNAVVAVVKRCFPMEVLLILQQRVHGLLLQTHMQNQYLRRLESKIVQCICYMLGTEACIPHPQHRYGAVLRFAKEKVSSGKWVQSIWEAITDADVVLEAYDREEDRKGERRKEEGEDKE